MCTPKEIAENYLSACRTKAALPLGRMFLARLPCGRVRRACGRRVHGCRGDGRRPSLAKLVSGCVFPAGLAMVIVAGSELFTGNNLMIMGVLARTITGAADAAQLARCLSGQLCGRGARCGAVRVGARLSAFGGKLAASVIAIAQTKAGAGRSAMRSCAASSATSSCASPSDGKCSQDRRR